MLLERVQPSTLLGSFVFTAVFWRRQRRLRGQGPGQRGFPRLLECAMGLCVLLWLHEQAARPEGVETMLRGGEVPPSTEVPPPNKYTVDFDGRVTEMTLLEIIRKMPPFVFVISDNPMKVVSLGDVKNHLECEIEHQRKFRMLNHENEIVPLSEEIQDIMQVKADLEDLICDSRGLPKLTLLANGRVEIKWHRGRTRVMSMSEARKMVNNARIVRDGITLFGPKTGPRSDRSKRLPLQEALSKYYRSTPLVQYLNGPGWKVVDPAVFKEVESATPAILVGDNWRIAHGGLFKVLAETDPG